MSSGDGERWALSLLGLVTLGYPRRTLACLPIVSLLRGGITESLASI